ncbi:ricin-type beta-trefoil lectin domain protein [Dactylosporangium vinaceum]|uniref:Ricin-type beta-trefoil lectin domain protein n=1 Tax=Dactylosporangium vinaceum TaxID=53362 RepID=A0ABV5MG97_9ACTN|nr:chitinase [Dactylosporangium vinaceum]UAB98986.1 ricin-type beta-trefoil lectin domain protein [Dactylosporangium vinaceum]
MAKTRLLRRGVIAAAALAVIGVVGVVAMNSASAATVGQITGFGGKCIDVAAASSANGTQVQLYTCNGTGAQQWTIGDDGTIKALGKCLDVNAASSANGTKVQIYDCNGTAAQQWSRNSDGTLRALGKCLDATGNSSADGTPLQLWDCFAGANQRWTLPGGTTTPPTTAGPTSNPPASNPAMGAAPYAYLGWGNLPDPRTIMSATGIKWFTMAFILSNGACEPLWDGSRPLTGGQDQTTINNIRGAGGDVAVSFGGASGPWLEQTCSSAATLAAAYQKVINAYGLKAIDIDIEGTVYNNPTLQQRTIDALKTVKANNPNTAVYVTFPSDRSGPDSSMINRAAASGLTVDAWTIMPFDFGAAGQNMGNLTIQAAEGLKNVVKNGYKYTDDQAYRHSGISSMNGITDVGETVTVADFRTMLAYAQQHHLARFTFWSANRDRPCNGGSTNDDTCSGVSQSAWDFTKVIAQYKG